MSKLYWAVAALCIIFSGTAHANSFNVAGWKVSTYESVDGRDVGCMMNGEYSGGTALRITVLNNYEWNLILFDASWRLKKGMIRANAYVDNRLIASGTAEALTPTLLFLPLNSADSYRSVQIGRKLELRTEFGEFKFQLTGTAKAMSAVLECVRTLNHETQTAASEPPRQYQEVPGAEAAILLTNMFNAAEIQGYKFRSEQSDNNVVSFSMEDGSEGAFFAHRGDTPSADDVAGSTISIEASGCKGDYMSGKQSVPSTDGSVIRKVLGTCRTNGATVVSETTIIRRNNGFLLSLVQYRMGTALSDTEDGLDAGNSASFIDAAMRIEEPR